MIRKFLLILAVATTTHACQVPVFRYALERWEADPFRLQVVHRDPLSPALEKLFLATNEDLSRKPSPANVTLETLDINQLSESQQLSVVGLDRVTQWPAFILHPPASWRNAPPLVLDADELTLRQILHSPARQRCVDDLLAGESAVWILIESGDAEADQAALTLLEGGLRRATDEIELPDGILRPGELGSAGGEVNLDDVLRSPIPLKISFKIERLRRDDPAEQVFLKLLTGPIGTTPDGPIIVPLFGRGRSPGPVSASAVNEDRIVQACAYLCGACSCQVKSGNPGYDLLFRASWHEHLLDGLIVVDKELPPLPGIGDLSQPASPPPEEIVATSTTITTINFWWIGAGILVLILCVGTLILTRKPRS